MSRGLFVTGTGTGVGKTHVGERIVRQLVGLGVRVGVYKPVESGLAERGGLEGETLTSDAWRLWRAAGGIGRLDRVGPQSFALPVVPYRAAESEGRQVDRALLTSGLEYWRERCELVVVEGAGGLFSPLTRELLSAGLARQIGYPLVLVAANRLGVIGDVIGSLFAARAHPEGPLTIAAVVLCDVAPSDHGDDSSRQTNYEDLLEWVQGPVVCRLAWQGEEFEPQVDWFEMAGSETA